MALADITEATPDTSSDEIKAYAESMIQEIEQDRKGESSGKSDAQIVNEQAGIRQPEDKPKETTAEKNSGSTTATDDGEDTGSTEESPEWLTDDVKAEAAAYGIDESELADFTSREELDRAFRLFDKTALEAGRKAMGKGEEGGATRNEKGQFVKQEKPQADESKGETPKDGRYEVQLDPDIYDEGIISELTRMRDHYESRLAHLESFTTEQQAVAAERQFDKLVDSLGHSDLFGATDKETTEEKQRRETLFEEVNIYLAGRKALGHPAELNEIVVRRITQALFAEELGKKLIKQKTRQLSKQSDGRMGGSPTKPRPPSEDPRDQFDRIYNEMSRKLT